jgi:DMSO/TMAO reductase YedYZ heme-binding membrane subunit
MSLDELLWLISRAAALTAFFVLAASLITGQALRTAIFGPRLRNRELAGLHEFLTICWLPFVALHLIALTLDRVAQITPLDLVVPFRVPYASLAVGLGTIGFDLLVVVALSSYLRSRLRPVAWRWLHRTSYVVFATFVVHAVLAGSDVTRSLILAPLAAVVSFLVITTLARVLFGRTSGVEA